MRRKEEGGHDGGGEDAAGGGRLPCGTYQGEGKIVDRRIL